jgi:hypothetical protein
MITNKIISFNTIPTILQDFTKVDVLTSSCSYDMAVVIDPALPNRFNEVSVLMPSLPASRTHEYMIVESNGIKTALSVLWVDTTSIVEEFSSNYVIDIYDATQAELSNIMDLLTRSDIRHRLRT